MDRDSFLAAMKERNIGTEERSNRPGAAQDKAKRDGDVDQPDEQKNRAQHAGAERRVRPQHLIEQNAIFKRHS